MAFPKNDPSNYMVLQTWFLVGMVILTCGVTLFATPFASWIIESSRDNKDFAAVTMVNGISGILGALFGQVLAAANAVSIALVFFVLGGSVSIYFAVTLIPNQVLSQVTEAPPIVPSVRTCIRTKEFRTLFINETLIGTGTSTVSQLIFPMAFLFYGYVNTVQVSALFVPVFVSVTIFGFIVIYFTNRAIANGSEKLSIYNFAMQGFIVFFVLIIGTLIPGMANYESPGTVSQFGFSALRVCFVIFFSLSLGACAIVFKFCQSIMIRDLVVFDTFVNKLNRENMFQTALYVPSGIVSSLIGNALGAIFYSFFYQSTNASDTTQISELYRFNLGAFVCLFLIIVIGGVILPYLSILTIQGYPMVTKVANQIGDIVRKREETEVENLKEFNANEDVENENKSGQTTSTSTSSKDKKLKDIDTPRANSSSTSESMETATRVPFAEEKMIWLNLSQLETKVICESPVRNGVNEGIASIRTQSMLGVLLFGPLCLAALITGTYFQVTRGLSFSTLLMTIALAVLFYVGYEVSRFSAISWIYERPVEEMLEMAKDARTRNENYQESLQSMLDNHKIAEDPTDEEINEVDEILDRYSIMPATDGKRAALAAADETEESHHVLAGYKRIYSMLVVGVVIGVLCSFQKHNFSTAK